MKRALLALLALAAGQAEAAKPACVTRHDMRTLIRVALPDAVEALATRCKPALPADAFLTFVSVFCSSFYLFFPLIKGSFILR